MNTESPDPAEALSDQASADGSGLEWPPVTVVIPTRNRPDLLDRAVRSVLEQRYEGPVECIVVFDQANPETPRVPVPMGRALRVIENDRKPGLAGARNTGILAGRGELVAHCDDDDEWMPDKLRLQVGTFKAAPHASIVASGIELHSSGRVFELVPDLEFVDLAPLLRSRMVGLHSSGMLARRSDLLGRIGLVDETLAGGQGEDYEFLLRAAKIAPIAIVRAPLVRVFWHPASFFSQHWDDLATSLTALLSRYPEFRTQPRGYARIAGQIAFACAASGDRRRSLGWTRRCLRADWRQPRAYLALLVSSGVVNAASVIRVANRFGKGI